MREMVEYVGDWQRYLALDTEEAEALRLGKHTRTGRPLGSESFVHDLEVELPRICGHVRTSYI